MGKKNILITGISGFVGKNLVNYFSSFPNIILYGLDIIFPELNNVKKIYSWDALSQLPKIDIIIHLAGKAHDLSKNVDERLYFDINYGLTKKIYGWFLKSEASKFIFMSSVKAVADTVNGVLTETAKASPMTVYGKSKLKAEEYIINNSVNKKKKHYILRASMIHGPGNKGNLNLLYKLVKNGFPYPLGEFNNKRSFVSIGNINFIMKRLIDKDAGSGIYHLADDYPISTVEVIKLISKELNKKEKIWNINKKLIRLLADIGDLLPIPLNNERLKKLTESYVVSNNKIKNVLGVDKMPVDTISGMKFTISSFNDLGISK